MSDAYLVAFVLGLLTALLIGTNGFWIYVTFQLHNRLMCRNYAEYASAERIKTAPNAATAPNDAAVDPVADEMAKRANSLFVM